MQQAHSVYRAFFRLKEDPFSLSPDPAFLYRSEQHEEALSNLIYGVQARKGFIVLTGEVGTGKTMMLECLRDWLSQQEIEFAFVFNSKLTGHEFLQMVAYDFSLTVDSKSKPDILAALQEMALAQPAILRPTPLKAPPTLPHPPEQAAQRTPRSNAPPQPQKSGVSAPRENGRTESPAGIATQSEKTHPPAAGHAPASLPEAWSESQSEDVSTQQSLPTRERTSPRSLQLSKQSFSSS